MNRNPEHIAVPNDRGPLRGPLRRLPHALRAACTLTLLAGSALAQQNPRPVEPHAQGVIVVTDGAALRRQPAMTGLMRLLREARVLPPIERAWKELSGAMGLDESAAFDRLLGRRVAVFFQQPTPGDPTDWAIASQVDGATEQLVRERLRPSPRGFIEGAPALTLENGAFELAVPQSKPQPGGTLLPTLVLGPRGGSMLDRLVPEGATPPPAPRIGAARDLRADVFALYREQSDALVPNYISAAAWAAESRWRLSYAGSRALLLGAAAEDHYTAPTALADPVAWAALSRDAALAYVGQARPEIPGAGAMITMVRQLAGDAPLPEPAGGAVALVLRELPGAWTLTVALPIVAGPDDAASGAASGTPTSIASAADISDNSLRAAARRGDAAIARALHAVGAGEPAPVDFAGRYPGAIRTASPAPAALAMDARAPALLRRTSWAWTYARAPGADRAWWIISVSGPIEAAQSREQQAADAVAAMRAAVAAPVHAAPGLVSPAPDVFRFAALPDALARGLIEAGLPEVGLVAALKEVQSVDWHCRPAAPGLVEGELILDVRSQAQN